MKITKFVHSCLLVEEGDRTALFDPGVFSWKAGVFDIDKVDFINRIIITHPHPDHLFPEFLKVVTDKFPDAQIIANEASQKIAKEAGVANVMRTESQCSVPFEAPHAEIEPFGKTPPNSGFHFKNKLTHPGDSHDFSDSKEILAMPFIAPWGTMINGIKKVLDLKPKHVIPIHDWHYSDAAKDWAYSAMKDELFEPAGITLHTPEPGETIDIE